MCYIAGSFQCKTNKKDTWYLLVRNLRNSNNIFFKVLYQNIHNYMSLLNVVIVIREEWY